jgi:pyruvate/2-oxoglutarate dehydrogenase complex dihydrolipoamide dehydrogenase (E3) component
VNGWIQTDAEMWPNQPHIFAAGDANNLHVIVHIVVEQGEIANHNALCPGEPSRRMDDRLFTEVIFTDP